MRIAAALLIVFALTTTVAADDGLPVQVLDRVKEATVFIKAGSGKHLRTGSGFLINVDGTTGLIATNEHVVAPFSKDDPQQIAVKVIFHSGEKGEMSAEGVVVAADKENDIALIRVRSIKDLPKPLSVLETAELRETMSVYAIGFPFGDSLSLTKGNPAVSLNRGSVSSLRKNEHGELARIQIEGTLNPGNSGGPVVDKNGRLVGVAVARVPGANIGFAVPPSAVAGMLEGGTQKAGLRVRKVVKGIAEVEIYIRLSDPLEKIEKISVRISRNDSFEEFKAGKDGKWSPIPMAEVVDLKIEADRTAIGTVKLMSNEKSVLYYSFQPVYVRSDKLQVYSRPSEPFRVDFRSDTAANLPTAPFRSKAIEITSKASSDWIFKEAKRGARLFSDSEYIFSELPDDVVGGTLLVRKSSERKDWLEPFTISSLTDVTVFAIIRTKRLGKEEVSEVTLTKLEREGWAEVKGGLETTFPNGEDWHWSVFRKNVKKGEISLQLKTISPPDTPVLFVFKGKS